jgi:uncharacterized protein with HEPN domain
MPNATPCMPSRDYLEFLLDIRDNARFAQQWTAAHTREAFIADTRTFYAVTRCLEIVSEASRRLPQELRDRHPQLPWRAIMDAGNVYRHRYDNVAEDLVWDTVRQDLPSLLAVAESEIASLPGDVPGGAH